jgi:hypothetical protein
MSTPLPKTYPRTYRSTAVGRQQSNLVGWWAKKNGFPIPTGPWKFYRPGIQAAGYRVSSSILFFGCSATRAHILEFGPCIKVVTMWPWSLAIYQKLVTGGNVSSQCGRFIGRYGSTNLSENLVRYFPKNLDYEWLSPYYVEKIGP